MREKQNAALSGWIVMFAKVNLVLLIALSFAGCSQVAPAPAQPVEPPTAVPTEVIPPTATPLPLPTATLEPTATATLEPTATPTEPPTATPLPALAVVENGFDAWCAPQEYAGTRPSGPDAPDYARKMVAQDTRILVPIPATYCALAYRFNQPVNGAVLTFYDGTNPFLKLPLQAVDGHPDQGWTPVTHTYVINPPLWFVDYRLAVTDASGKELWTHSVRFAKPLPEPCQFGGYPDPVTMYCTPTDPWEIEPWPDVKYPYPRRP